MISILLCVFCAIFSLTGLLYIKDVILQKYMDVSVYTFSILGTYNYYESFIQVFLTMLSIIIPFHTLYIIFFSKEKYFLSILSLFPFIFVEVLFTITPPLYCTPYILYCMIVILSKHQVKIHIIPICLSICLLLGVFYMVPPSSYSHRRLAGNNPTDVNLSGPNRSSEVYNLMDQGNRYYTNKVELKVEGITGQSFKLRGMVYQYFDGQWIQGTSPSTVNYPYSYNIKLLSEHFGSQRKTITIKDLYYEDVIYTPYFGYPLSDDIKYYRSHFEGKKEEKYDYFILNKDFNNYMELAYDEKEIWNKLTLKATTYPLNYEGFDIIPEDTYEVLNRFMIQHHLYEYENLQELIKKAKKAMFEETEYSLRPGKTPSDENFFEYFLYKNKKGYCVHYASSLALILRIQGFHANFVTGYQVEGKNSVQDYTNVYDSSSHAWVEIDDPILGMIPVEATPSSSTDNVQNNVTNPIQNNIQETPKDQEVNTIIQNEINEKEFKIPIYVYYFLSLIIIVSFIYLQSRIRFNRQWIHLNNNQRVCKMYYNLNEFKVPITKEIMYLIKKAKFSPYQLSHEEYQRVFTYYNDQLKVLYNQSQLFYKLKLKYIKAVI